MFVLSVEGWKHLNRDTWVTHKIVGVYDSANLAHEAAQKGNFTDEDIVILTDVTTGNAKRVPTSS